MYIYVVPIRFIVIVEWYTYLVWPKILCHRLPLFKALAPALRIASNKNTICLIWVYTNTEIGKINRQTLQEGEISYIHYALPSHT